MATYELSIPIPEVDVRRLHIGDTVTLSGLIVTGRDTAHKYLIENFVRAEAIPESERLLHGELRRLLREGVIYHCGPVVRRTTPGGAGEEGWEFVAAGPTTSIREEPYEADVIAHFRLRGVIGKGGMGPRTLEACREHGAVYFHAVGGAASLIADAVKEVVTVYKKEEFGVPEAFWVIRVEGFPVVVTMDTHGQSIHDQVEAASEQALNRLLATP
jgi:fumarate hydratase subunit beta